MGEIKSTLDLVMERTKHLSLSAEEKAQQQKENFEKRLQGLLQQYADGALSVDAFQKGVSELSSELGVTGHKQLVAAICNRIDPEQDNGAWLELLENIAPAMREPLARILEAFHARQNTLWREGEQRQRERLAQHHAIRGAAVIPNPLRDEPYNQEMDKLGQGSRKEIDQMLQQTLSPES